MRSSNKLHTMFISLCFDETYRLTFNEKCIIHFFIITCGIFTNSNSKRSYRIELLAVLNYPSSIFKLLVYYLSCLFFWTHIVINLF